MTNDQADRVAAHGVTEMGCHADHVRSSTAAERRPQGEAGQRRAVRTASEGRAQHAKAVLALRAAVTEAFLSQVRGEPVASPGALALAVSEPRADAINEGLQAARAEWGAAPYEVRIEVYQLDLVVGAIRTSYDLSTVPSNTTVEDGFPHTATRAHGAA